MGDREHGVAPGADPFGEERAPRYRRLFGRDRGPLSRSGRLAGFAAGILLVADGAAFHGLLGRLAALALLIAPGWWFNQRARDRRRREQETILPGAPP